MVEWVWILAFKIGKFVILQFTIMIHYHHVLQDSMYNNQGQL
jgi:hypothetical protein